MGCTSTEPQSCELLIGESRNVMLHLSLRRTHQLLVARHSSLACQGTEHLLPFFNGRLVPSSQHWLVCVTQFWAIPLMCCSMMRIVGSPNATVMLVKFTQAHPTELTIVCKIIQGWSHIVSASHFPALSETTVTCMPWTLTTYTLRHGLSNEEFRVFGFLAK
jgi:hypothetical protein